MKILLLSNPTSSHTIKWARSLALKGFDLIIFGLNNTESTLYSDMQNIKIIGLNMNSLVNSNNEGTFQKLNYILALPLLKKTIKEFKPDVLHAHYASSYGVLGALCGFQPYVLSVWGSDVFNFPNISFLHKWTLKFALSRATKVLSTSHVMALETKKYTSKIIEITPFGVDLSAFKPILVSSPFALNDIIIGTVKTLEEKYGIEYLIRAFYEVRCQLPDLPLKLLIIGSGSLESSLKSLVTELSLNDCTRFTGRVPFQDIPKYHNMLSINVSVSICNSESFGVAIIESNACGKPVIVSSVGGLPEVVQDNVTGIVVPPKDVTATANAIKRLVLNAGLRQSMGQSGRSRVQRLYDWDANVIQMINIYGAILQKNIPQ